MTSVVDKYYSRIIQNIDNVRMKSDISSLLVKTKEHDSKINTNESDISDNLTKIGANETNISSNLSKIETNETNISSNLRKINSIEENNLKISNNVFNDKYDIEKNNHLILIIIHIPIIYFKKFLNMILIQMEN